MANIVLRNGWNQPATYKNVASVTFQTDVEGVMATYYENGSGGSGGLGAQANWSQNNDQAADYIKNRPFYSSYEEIIAPIAVELTADSYEGLDLYGVVLGELSEFTETEYTVIWGDDLWFCDIVEKEGKKYLGNLNLVGITTETTEEDTPPFVGIYENGLLTFYSDSAVALNIGLGGPEIIHKINAKYLPDGLTGNADWDAKEGEPGYIANKPTIPTQVQSNWTQSDSSKADFIRNKPSFYANWNAKEGTSRIVDMPEVFRHSTETEGMEEVLLDTPEGWIKKEVTKLTMTVTFDDDTVKVYSMVGTEVTS